MVPDGSQPGIFYRGDSRPPKEIFETGFKPQGDDMDLRRHLSFGGNSGYVSVSRSRRAAARYSFDRLGNRKEVGYLYRIAPNYLPDGYWIPGWYRGLEIEGNQEFAIPGEVPGYSIHSARALYLREPSRKGEWIKNPRFNDQSAVCSILKRELCGRFPAEEDLEKTREEAEEEEATLDELFHNEDEDLVATANVAADRHFTSLARKLEIRLEEPDKLIGGLHEYSVRFQRHRKVLSVAEGERSMLTKLKLSDVLNIIALPFYLESVRDSFRHNAVMTRKLATVTAIVPFAGCTFDAVNHREEDEKEGSTRLHVAYSIDETLCLTSDVLLFSPLRPVAILARIISPLAVAYASGNLGQVLDRDFVFEYREREWNRTLSRIKDALASASYKRILQRSYGEELSASLFTLSQQSVLLYTGRRLALKDDVSDEESLKINATFHAEFMKVQRQVCHQMNRTNHRFEEDIAVEVGDSIRHLQKEHYRRFAGEYYKKMKAEEEKVLRNGSSWLRLLPRLGHERYWRRLNKLVDELRTTEEPEFDDGWIVWRVQRSVMTALDFYECGECDGVYSSLSEVLKVEPPEPLTR
ncbi:hypothetical protein CP532_3541 [Ophiocordyceps camponoti-leonardi (nom. inval.)]|nr:hypothetical protein CP532_3541 [Ophiocordyceps camponoti-leonardi (nom. inval.)]